MMVKIDDIRNEQRKCIHVSTDNTEGWQLPGASHAFRVARVRVAQVSRVPRR